MKAIPIYSLVLVMLVFCVSTAADKKPEITLDCSKLDNPSREIVAKNIPKDRNGFLEYAFHQVEYIVQQKVLNASDSERESFLKKYEFRMGYLVEKHSFQGVSEKDPRKEFYVHIPFGWITDLTKQYMEQTAKTKKNTSSFAH